MKMYNWLIGGASLFVLYKGVQYGIIYGKKRLNDYILQRVLDELNLRMEEEEHFKPMHSNSALIKMKSGGKTYSVYVPYNKRKSSAMLRRRVYLIKGDEKIDISQKPGIPYIVCAEDLGGDYIVVENLDGEIVKKYEKKEIPTF